MVVACSLGKYSHTVIFLTNICNFCSHLSLNSSFTVFPTHSSRTMADSINRVTRRVWFRVSVAPIIFNGDKNVMWTLLFYPVDSVIPIIILGSAILYLVFTFIFDTALKRLIAVISVEPEKQCALRAQ